MDGPLLLAIDLSSSVSRLDKLSRGIDTCRFDAAEET